MNMNYFRLLFCRWNQCLVHFGEWKDTISGENFRLLYLSEKEEKEENEEPADQGREKTGYSLFLCPKSVDLLVLGENNGTVLKKVEELLKEITVDTLVCPEWRQESEEVFSRSVNSVKRIICLPEETVEGVNAVGGVRNGIFSVSAAGWDFSVSCVDENALAVMYEPEAGRMKRYEDCVTRVKRMSGTMHCRISEEPDGYGCALGCARHSDHEVCGFSGKEQGLSCLLGTMLFPLSGIRNLPKSVTETNFLDEPNIPEENVFAKTRELLKQCTEKARFFVVTDSSWKLLFEEGAVENKGVDKNESPGESTYKNVDKSADESLDKSADKNTDSGISDSVADSETASFSEYRRYYISTAAGLSGETLRRICDTGVLASPVFLQENEGICCSGFLKYRDQNI
ncbi:MAG: hypothetical protein LUH07_11270 [Lachnospiraceae bacterium]|nr:hypothetical protein [Lachnospiraceae bacterium]